MTASEQARHQVRRETIEVVTTDRATAERLGQRVEALARGSLRRALEDALDQSAPGGPLIRIARLELNVGTVSANALESALPALLARVLPAALARTLSEPPPTTTPESSREFPSGPVSRARASGEPRADAAGDGDAASQPAELLRALARTGAPPWWYERAQDPGTDMPLLARTVRELLELAPGHADRLLRALASEPAARRRLALQLDSELFERVSRLLAPASDPEALLRHAEAAMALTPEGVLAGAARRGLLAREALLGALANRHADLLAQVSASLERLNAPVSGERGEVGSAAAPPEGAPAQRRVEVALRSAAARLEWAAPLLHSLAGAAVDLSDGAVADVLAALRRLTAASPHTSPPHDALVLLLRPFLAEGAVDRAALDAALEPMRRQLAPPDLPPSSLRPGTPTAKVNAEPGVPVHDSGLCLLWPFLTAFFGGLGLLDEERRWRDRMAPNAAAAVLDRVATGARLADEARLPLAKLLCGLPADTIHEPVEPPAEAEPEVAAFLQAMLGHFRPLGHLSVEGLRHSWLLRPGILGTRDGLPLLRVEQRGYDLLLDRLPWPRDWVRLPWMLLPLRVEW